MGKSSIWWGGVFLAVTAAQASAQQSAQSLNTADRAAGEVQVLSPLQVQGQSLLADLPEGTTITTRQQLDQRAIESWEDFSKRGEPGVNFNTQNNSVNIRGLDGDRIVTRVDGIRVPWLQDGARDADGGLDTIAFNSLSAIDLVRGAGSTQSGSLIGYLDLRTLSPRDLLAPGKDFGALLKSGYNSADDSIGADAALAGRFGGSTRWLLQAGHRQGHELDNMGKKGGLGPTRERPDPADYKQNNVMLKLEQDFGAEHMVSLAADAFRRSTTIDYLKEPGRSYAPGQSSKQKESERDRVVLGYQYQSAAGNSLLDHGEAKLYWQRVYQEDGFTANRTSAVGRGFYNRKNSMQEDNVGLLTAWGGFIDGGVVKHRWAAGGEWVSNDTKQQSRGIDNCPPAGCPMLHTNQSDMPRAKGNQYALWAQDEISWGEGKYALTPALRFDAYSQKPKMGGQYANNPNAGVISFSDNSGQRVSPSLLATYRPREDLAFFAKYGYGFKAPNATQLFLSYGAPGSYISLGNPDLKPEISRGWELGAEAGDSERGVRLAIFDTHYRDYIDSVQYSAGAPGRDPQWTRDNYGTVYHWENRARVRIYGAELSGQWAFNSNWYSWGSLAWTRGKDQENDSYLNSMAPLKAIVALGYKQEQWGVESILTLAKRRSEVEYGSDAPNPDFKAPGYGLLDLTAWITPRSVKGLRLQAGVYNVFDKKYWNALDVPTAGASAIPNAIDSYTQPGRSIRASLTYQY